ncbi:putative amino acid transporter [Trypanosoma vivax]|nr:putative amino acid transporter [Trypanosoma vivax]
MEETRGPGGATELCGVEGGHSAPRAYSASEELETNDNPPVNSTACGIVVEQDTAPIKDPAAPSGACLGDGKKTDRDEVGKIQENTNIYKTAFHVFKANVGTGIFILPMFYRHAGYIAGLIIALFTGIFVLDASQLLLRTKLIINREDVDTYGRVCRHIYGKTMEWILFACLILTQYAFCLLYVQLAVSTMGSFVSFSGDAYVWGLVIFLIVFPCTCFSNNFSLLAIASIVASVSVVVTLIITYIRIATELKSNGPHESVTAFGDNVPFGWFTDMACNLMVLEGIAIVLPAHSGCNQKHLFKPMLTVILGSIVCLYIFYGLSGYFAYGSALNEVIVKRMSDQGDFRIPMGCAFILNVICTYPLQFQPAMQLIDVLFNCKESSLKGRLIRLSINVFIIVLAIILGGDTVDMVVGITGALPAVVIVMIIPSLLTLKIDLILNNLDNDKLSFKELLAAIVRSPFSFRKLRCIFYIVFGLLVMGFGTYAVLSPSKKNEWEGLEEEAYTYTHT